MIARRPSAAHAQARERERERERAPEASAAPELESYVAAAVAGDERARARLVEALLPRARNLVRFLVRGDAESDDIVQDALVIMLERLASYRGEARLERWADGVVMRVTLHHLRRLRRRLRRFVSRPPEELESQPDVLVPAPVLRSYAARREVIAALDRLPYKQRHALVLHHVLGMTVHEVAAELGVPHETLHSRLRAGMKTLRRSSRRLHLLREGDEL
jgi:RNA polymerase sigma-70 factor, ECF subfamily